MSKMITAGMVGFWLGMKCKEGGKSLCIKRMKRQAMRKLGL